MAPPSERLSRPFLDEWNAYKFLVEKKIVKNLQLAREKKGHIDPGGPGKGGSLGQRQVNRLFADYCELASHARVARNEAPIANSVRHVHCLKHSRGTSLAERGVNPYRIKLILGHKSMASTERYLHGSQKQAWAEAQPPVWKSSRRYTTTPLQHI